MVYRYTSSKSIIGRVSRLVDSADWKSMGSLYLSDGIQKIGLNHATKYTATKGNDLEVGNTCLLPVANHLAEIPSDLEILVRVFYKGLRLPYSIDPAIHALNGCDDYLWGKNGSGTDFYAINDGFIKTSFASGEIKLIYKKFDCDQEGFIMIPDVVEYKEALVWTVFTSLLLEGYKAKLQGMSFGEAESRAYDKVSVARGRMKQMNKDEREALSKQLTTKQLSGLTNEIIIDR